MSVKRLAVSGSARRLILLAVLAIAALFLGNLVGNRFLSKEGPQTNTNEQQEASLGPGPEGTSPTSGIVVVDGVELKFPTPERSLTPEEQEETDRKLNQLAKDVDSLRISAGCAISPRVARVKAEGFTLINEDTIEYEVFVGGQEKKITVPLSGRVEVGSSDFPAAIGNFSLGCEGGVSSFIVVQL